MEELQGFVTMYMIERTGECGEKSVSVTLKKDQAFDRNTKILAAAQVYIVPGFFTTRQIEEACKAHNEGVSK